MILRRIVLFILFISFFLSKSIIAQGCLENLYKAQKLLEKGNTESCLAYAVPCSGKSNDLSVRWQAYRLVSIAWLLKGNTDSARTAAENMLDINPTYKPNLLKDPKEFITLVSHFVVIPEFTFGVAFSLGANITFPQITQGYAVSDYTKTYTAKNSFQFGTNIGFYINPKVVLNVGFLATSKQFLIDYGFTNWEVKVAQRLTYMDIPVTAQYIFLPSKRMRYFLQGGVFGGYLLYSENDFTSTQVAPSEEYQLIKLNSSDRQNKINIGLTAGLGTYYKIKQGHLMLQANYFRSYSNIVNTAKRYNYNELIYTYFYIDDDIRLHNLAVSLGYSRYLNYKVYRTRKPKI